MNLLTRWIHRPRAEEAAAVEAARRSKAAAEDARALADEIAEASEREYRRVHQLRADNHLGWWLVEFARRGEREP